MRTFLILLLSVITCFAPPPGGNGGRRRFVGNLTITSSSSFPSGLIHYWSMNEASGDRADSIGGLTLSEFGGSVAGETGINGNAARLTSLVSGSLISGGTDAFSEPMTVAIWIKYFAFLSFAVPFTIDDGSDDYSNLALTAPNVLTYWERDGMQSVSTTIPSLNAWHLYVCVLPSSGAVQISLDGAAFISGSSVTGDSTIGQVRSGTGSDGTTDCLVDAIMVFNHALSATEVTSLWNGGSGLFP